jgi:hypothetical protein
MAWDIGGTIGRSSSGDPKMLYSMNNKVETAHAFRYVETGKGKIWDGLGEAVTVGTIKDVEKKL